MSHKNILQALIVISAISFSIGLFNVLNGNFSGIAYPFIPLGIFIWGYTIVISPLLGIGSLWFLKKNNYVLTGLFLSTYYLIRSFIEALYSLNAQFSNISRPWEAYWETSELVILLGKTEVFVLSQLIFTSVTIISLLVFTYYLKKYLELKH